MKAERKAVHLTSKPNQVVLTTLYSGLIRDLSIHSYVFSTIKPAVKWLNKAGVDDQFLKQIINGLKTKVSVV